MLELSEDEREILRSVLEDDVSELRMEITRTDAQEFRDALKHRAAVLKRLVSRLGMRAAA